MALDKSLKEAVLRLSREEKDKMLLRLIGKHKDLQEQLYFQLIEDGDTLPERREHLHAEIDRVCSVEYGSVVWLLGAMRKMHAGIAYHVKITKDKYGEVELVLYLLNQCFERQPKYANTLSSRAEPLADYLVRRAEAILKKWEKLHPDIRFEFLDDVNRLLEHCHSWLANYFATERKLPKRLEVRE